MMKHQNLMELNCTVITLVPVEMLLLLLVEVLLPAGGAGCLTTCRCGCQYPKNIKPTVKIPIMDLSMHAAAGGSATATSGAGS